MGAVSSLAAVKYLEVRLFQLTTTCKLLEREALPGCVSLTLHAREQAYRQAAERQC